MFDSFSLRSRQIVFAARVKAGERGANMIDIDDVLVGLILEDEGMLEMLEEGLFPKLREGRVHLVNEAPLHIPFFSPEIANDFLAKIEGILPRAEPVGTSTEIPLSSAVVHAFNSAEEIHTRFGHSHEAAVVSEFSESSSPTLRERGLAVQIFLRRPLFSSS